MKTELDLPADSYEASLTEEQRISFRALLLSGVTLAEAHEKILPWQSGPDQGKKPSLSSLGRTRVRLRIREKAQLIEEARLTTRATRTLVRRLGKGSNEKELMDSAVALLGEKLIDGCLGLGNAKTGTGAAWLLLRREDQRMAQERLAIFRQQTLKSSQAADEIWHDEIRKRIRAIGGK